MTLVFAVLAALVAAGAVFMVLDPLRRHARRQQPTNAPLLDEIEREVRALRAQRGGRPGGGA